MDERGIDRGREIMLSNKEAIGKIATEAGYTAVTSPGELGLTQEQLRKIQFGRPDNEATSFFKATRADEQEVIALIRALQSRYIAADIFSPAFQNGHTSNADFLDSELKEILAEALKPIRTS